MKQLENIQQVEAPSFLYTRIQQRIKNEVRMRVSGKTIWTAAISLCFVIVINFYSIIHIKQNTNPHQNTAEVFELMPDHNFYK